MITLSWLLIWQTEFREKETQRDKDFLSACSLFKWPQWSGLGKLETSSRAFSRSPVWVTEMLQVGCLQCFSRHILMAPNWSWAAGTQTGCTMGCLVLLMLAHYATCQPPYYLLLVVVQFSVVLNINIPLTLLAMNCGNRQLLHLTMCKKLFII